MKTQEGLILSIILDINNKPNAKNNQRSLPEMV